MGTHVWVRVTSPMVYKGPSGAQGGQQWESIHLRTSNLRGKNPLAWRPFSSPPSLLWSWWALVQYKEQKTISPKKQNTLYFSIVLGQCTVSRDCTDPALPICLSGTCVECAANANCADDPMNSLCDLAQDPPVCAPCRANQRELHFQLQIYMQCKY